MGMAAGGLTVLPAAPLQRFSLAVGLVGVLQGCVRYSGFLGIIMNKHSRLSLPSTRIAPKTLAARMRSAGSARRLELKKGANGMLVYAVVTTTRPSRFELSRSSPGKPPKAQKIGAQRHVITTVRRSVPVLSEESRGLHRKIAEAGDQLSLANISQSLLARYGAK